MDLYDDIYTAGAQSPDTTIENQEHEDNEEDDGTACNDLDLYDDLITEEGQQQMDSYKELCEKFEAAISKINNLESENKKLREETQKYSETHENVQKNISSLLITARTELSRKEREIKNLRSKLSSPFQRRGIYNGCRNQIRRLNKDSSESFTSVDSNFEPMLVSSPVESSKERKHCSVDRNNKKSFSARERDKSQDSEKEVKGLSVLQKRSNFRMARSLTEIGDKHDKEIENKTISKKENEEKNSRKRDMYERNNSRQTKNNNERELNHDERLSAKQSINKVSESYIYGEQNDSSPDSSPVKPQKLSQTLFSQRALKKLSEEKTNQDKEKSRQDKDAKLSGQRKLSPERNDMLERDQSPKKLREIRFENILCKESSKTKENEAKEKFNKIDDGVSKRCEGNNTDEVVVKIAEKHKSDRTKNYKNNPDNETKNCKINTDIETGEKPPKKIVDLREKLRLKRQMKNAPASKNKQEDWQVKNSSKRRLDNDQNEISVKRKKYDTNSNMNDPEVFVEVDTTVNDEEISPKRTLSDTSHCRQKTVETDKGYIQTCGTDKSEHKEKLRNIVSYSETNLIDTKYPKSKKLFETIQREKAAQAEVDRLKKLMRVCEVPAGQQHGLKAEDTPNGCQPCLAVNSCSSKKENIFSTSNEMENCKGSSDSQIAELEISKDISDSKNKNTSGNSDTSLLYANIGEETLEISSRSVMSDNLDAEIFKPIEGEKDHVSSSSTNIVQETPSLSSPVSTLKRDSAEITSTVVEDENMVDAIEKTDKTEVKNAEIINIDSDTEKCFGNHLRLENDINIIENPDVELKHNSEILGGMLETVESKVCNMNEVVMENRSPRIRNEQTLLKMSIASSSLESELDDVLIENNTHGSKKKRKRKHKKERKRRKSKSVNSSLSNHSELEDSENEICDIMEQANITEKVATPDTEKGLEALSRTPKHKKESSVVYRGVISETVSAVTSNVIDHDEDVFLSPARPLKTKRRSKGESKEQKSPVKSYEAEHDENTVTEKAINVGTCISEKRKVVSDHAMLCGDETNDRMENGFKDPELKEDMSSHSATSIKSYTSSSEGSFGSNIISEKTSSLSLSGESDGVEHSFSSQTSGSSFISSSSSSVTSFSATSIVESSESYEAVLSESQSSCEKHKAENQTETSDPESKLVEQEKSDNGTDKPLTMGKNFDTVIERQEEKSESKKTVFTKASVESVVMGSGESEGNVKSHVGSEQQRAATEASVADNKNMTENKNVCRTKLQGDTHKMYCDKVTESLDTQEHDTGVSKRRRHHTDGCLRRNGAYKGKRSSERGTSLDRSLLLQCLLNEIASIYDNSHNFKENVNAEMKAKEMKIKSGSDIDLHKYDQKSCVVKDQANNETVEIETSESEVDELMDITISNEIVSAEKSASMLTDKISSTRNSKVSAEELVFGSWTGLSIAVPMPSVSDTETVTKSNGNGNDVSIISKSELSIEEKGADQTSSGPLCQPSDENIYKWEVGTDSQSDIFQSSIDMDPNQEDVKNNDRAIQGTPVSHKTSDNIATQIKTNSNRYFEIDEEPDFLCTTRDCIGSISETSLKSSLNSSSVSAVSSNTTVTESETYFPTSDTVSTTRLTDSHDQSLNNEHDVTFDFISSLKKTPNKVKMVRRTSPSKLKYSARLGLAGSEIEQTAVGYFPSPKKLMNTVKSASADSVLTSILKRNTEHLQPVFKSPSKENNSGKQRKSQDSGIQVDSEIKMKEKEIPSVQERGRAIIRKLEKSDRNTEQEELSNYSLNQKKCLKLKQSHQIPEEIIMIEDDMECESDKNDRNSKHVLKSADKCDENSQKSSQHSETEKYLKSQTLSPHTTELGNESEKRKSKSPTKKHKIKKVAPKCNKQADNEKNVGRGSSVRKSRDENERLKSVVDEKGSLKLSKADVANVSASRNDLKHNRNEKPSSVALLRRSPRKKCIISSKETKNIIHAPEIGKKKVIEKQSKDKEMNKDANGAKGGVQKVQSAENNNEALTNKILQKTPSKVKSASFFDELGSPAKNTRSATKLNGERKPAAVRKEHSAIINTDGSKKQKVHSDCKETLAFSHNIILSDTEFKSNDEQNKGLKQNESVRNSCGLECKLDTQNSEREKSIKNMKYAVQKNVKPGKLEHFRRHENTQGIELKLQNQNMPSKEINVRKSQGHTDLLRTNKGGTAKNKQVQAVKSNTKASKTNGINCKASKQQGLKQKETDRNAITNTKFEMVKRQTTGNDNSKTKDDSTDGNEFPYEIHEHAKVTEEFQDTKTKSDSSKTHRTQKIKQGLYKDLKNLESGSETTFKENQQFKKSENDLLIDDEILSSDEREELESEVSKIKQSVKSNSNHSLALGISNKKQEEIQMDRFVAGSFEEMLSECDYAFEKQANRKTARHKSMLDSAVKIDCSKKQRQLIAADKSVGKAREFQTADSEKSDKMNKLYSGSGERANKFGTESKLEREFKKKTDCNDTETSVDVRLLGKCVREIPRKGILDKVHSEAVVTHKSHNREKYFVHNRYTERHTDESKIPVSDFNGSDSNSDADSVKTDRTAILNKSLFGSDSSGDESVNSFKCYSPLKSSTWQKHKTAAEKTVSMKKAYSCEKSFHDIHGKSSEGSNSFRSVHMDSDKQYEIAIHKELPTASSCNESAITGHIDEQTQCSLLVNTLSESRCRGTKTRLISGTVNSGNDGIQALGASLTSASGTLLLDCEDTLDHTDYVDSLLHDRSLTSNTSLSNTSKSDQSFLDNSSQCVHESLHDKSESLEDGEVMSSDSETVKNSPLKPKRISARHGISKLATNNKGKIVYSPVKFPKDDGNKKSVIMSQTAKSAKMLVRRKENHDTRDREHSSKIVKDSHERHLRGLERQQKSESPERHRHSKSSITHTNRTRPRTPKGRSDGSALSRRRSISRSPRRNRRSMSHSPRSRYKHRSRSFSRSPGRRYHKSRSQERKDYSRNRCEIPACISKSTKKCALSPHRSCQRSSPPRHRNTSPYYKSRPDRGNRSRSPSGSPHFHRRARREHHYESLHYHRHSDCDKTNRARKCCETNTKETHSRETCKHSCKSDSHSEYRSRHPVRHSDRHVEHMCQKRKRQSRSGSESGQSRSGSREKHCHKQKRQRANLSRHYDYSSEENNDSDRSHH